MNTIDIFSLIMPQLHKERLIRVWKPSDYDKNTNKKYPVIYMHDGQNLFDQSTSSYGEIWQVPTTIEKLISDYGFEGAIVVGIDNAPGLERLDEYSPWKSEKINEMKAIGEYTRDIGGEGKAYGAFIVETLKPLIDMKYRTLTDRDNTCVAGSSMGGFISLYLGAEYPEIFSKIGAFSTAAWFAEEALHTQLKKIDTRYHTRWYLDIGTKETSNEEIAEFNDIYIKGTLAIKKALLKLDIPIEDIKVVIDEGGKHNEVDWARRLPEALKWIFEIE